MLPGQLNSPRKKEKVVLGGFNSEIRQGQQKKKKKKKKNYQQLNETKSALLGREGASLPPFSFQSTGQVGPQAFWLRRSLAAGEAGAIKDDIWLSKDALKGEQAPGGPLPTRSTSFVSCCPWPFPGVIRRL